MPLLDMPLADLQTYQGRNPKPADFEAYWERGLAEMKATAANVELIPAQFQCAAADCFDLYFTGVGGARVHAKYLRPKLASSEHPAVVSFHGYTGNSGDWAGHLKWVSEGYSVAALDCRGQSGLSEDVGGVKGTTHNGHIIRGLDDSPEKLLYRSIFLDCAQVVGIVMDLPEVDASRVGTIGGSQGGALSLVAAALEPRVARCGTHFPFLCDYQRVWEMDLAKGAYQELRNFFRGHDPRHERETEIFTRLGYIDVQHLTPRIRGEVLMITGLMDDICPPSTQFAAYNKIKSKKSVTIYPDYGHEGFPGADDHFHTFMRGL